IYILTPFIPYTTLFRSALHRGREAGTNAVRERLAPPRFTLNHLALVDPRLQGKSHPPPLPVPWRTCKPIPRHRLGRDRAHEGQQDRKSTRLNSSHVTIS